MSSGVSSYACVTACTHYCAGMTKRTYSSHLTAREQVNRLLTGWDEKRATQAEWSRYRDEGWVADEVASRIINDRLSGRTITSEPEPAAATSHPELAEFITARTLLAARSADSDPRVSTWRQQHLPEGVLRVEQLPEWISEQVSTAGPTTTYVTVQVPADWQPGQPIDTAGQRVGVSTRPLPYVPDAVLRGDRYVGGNTHYAPTVAGSALDQLRELGASLAAEQGWAVATATTYVLTGIAPQPDLLSVGAQVRLSRRGGIRQRITINADPDVPPDVVAAAFRAERTKLRGPRARLPQPRMSRLAAFAAQYQDQAVTLGQLRYWWNTEHPDDTYSDLRAFRQALRDATRRVLGQPRPSR